jgi:polyisoprenoid-binding protein YceI
MARTPTPNPTQPYTEEKESLMTTRIITLAAAMFLSSTASAVEVDAGKSIITWKASKVTGAGHFGQMPVKSSKLKLVKGRVSSGSIVFDMQNFTVTDLKGKWQQKFLGHMKSPDFFDVAKFPTASLQLTSIKGNSAKGTLSIKGTSRPTTFSVQFKDGMYVGKTSFDRTKFGLKYGSGSFFKGLGDKAIRDVVEVEFKIAVSGR